MKNTAFDWREREHLHDAMQRLYNLDWNGAPMKNLYRVPKDQWQEWSEQAQAVFNALYVWLLDNPGLVLPKGMEMPAPKHCKILAWNVGWLAADAVDDNLPDEISDITPKGKVVARTKVKRSRV